MESDIMNCTNSCNNTHKKNNSHDFKQEKEVHEDLKEIENIENKNCNKKGYHNMYKLLDDLEK
jgi:hypothetical protein